MMLDCFSHYKPLWEVWLCISYRRVRLFKILFTSLKIWHALKWCYYTSVPFCQSGCILASSLPESWKDLLLHTKDHQMQEGNLSFAKPSKNVHRGNYSETSSFSDWILAVFTLSRARCRNPPDGIKCSASDCVSPEENVLNQLSSLLNLMIWRNYDFKACWRGFETWLKEHFSKLH